MEKNGKEKIVFYEMDDYLLIYVDLLFDYIHSYISLCWLRWFLALEKLFIFPILLYIFIYIDNRRSRLTILDLCRHFIYGMISYVFISLFLYYYELPIWEDYHVYWGRLTVGYPTIDTVVLGFAMVAVLFNKHLEFGVLRKTLFSLILTIGIMMQASGTGIVVLAVILLASILYLIANRSIAKGKESHSNTSKVILLYIMLLVLTSGSAYALFKQSNKELAYGMEAQITNRINIISGKKDDSALSDINTLEARMNYMKSAEKYLRNSECGRLLGVGYGNVSMTNYGKTEYIMFEDQYHLNIFTIGYIGTTICFIMFLNLILILKKRVHDLEALFFFEVPTIILLASNFTSICLSAFGILSICALFYSMSIKPINYKGQ